MRFRRSPDLSTIPLADLEAELCRRELAVVPLEAKVEVDALAAGRLMSVNVSEVLAVTKVWRTVAEDALVQVRQLASECGQLRAESARAEREAHQLARALMDDIDDNNGVAD